jgi:hypothetical protein
MKTRFAIVSRWIVAASAAVLLGGSAAPARAQAPLPMPPGGGIREMMAWQAQFNQWLNQVGDFSAYGIPRDAGNGVQQAIVRSQNLQRFIRELEQQHGFRVPGPYGMTLKDKLDWAQDLNRQNEHLFPNRMQGRERALFLAKLYYDAHDRMARFYAAQGDHGTAAIFRQQANQYAQMLRQLGGR